MQTDLHIQYQDVLDMSHHGWPTIVETIHTGNCGCPCISIDSDFLHWGYSPRTVSGIEYFLGVHRNTVRSALLEHGILQPHSNPFQSPLEEPIVLRSMMNYLIPHLPCLMHSLLTSNCQSQWVAPTLIPPGLIPLHILDPCPPFQMKISTNWLSDSAITFDMWDLVCLMVCYIGWAIESPMNVSGLH